MKTLLNYHSKTSESQNEKNIQANKLELSSWSFNSYLTKTHSLSKSEIKLFTTNDDSLNNSRSESVDFKSVLSSSTENQIVNINQNVNIENEEKNSTNGCKSSWDILCKIINCKVAFKKQFNGKKYNWIQLAGHAGRFKPGEREGYILKLMDNLERKCLEKLQTDNLAKFVPSIDKILLDNEDDNYYTEMQDLLYGFQNPSIMDIKIGVRTFLESDTNEKEKIPRQDLYLKLIEVAPNEPTEKEHEIKAITKRRYMSWREKSTCSATLGFRIEAIKKNQVKEKEFYSVKEKSEVQFHFKQYTDNKKSIMKMYLDRLIELKHCLKNSKFFYDHEMIGSSLLFVHDDKKANIWMIDFGKTRPLPNGIRISHDQEWQEGNHEDGYLIGIQNLIDIFQETILLS